MGFKSSGKYCDHKNIFYNPFVTIADPGIMQFAWSN